MKAGRILIIAAVLVIAIVGALSTSRKSTHPLERLVVADAQSVLATPVWVAEAKDFFRAEGLDATVHHFEAGKDAFAEVLRGRADVAAQSATPIALASLTRQDFVVLATIGYADNDCKLIARRDRQIKSLGDLRGKTMGMTKGTSDEYFLEALLAYYGIPRETLVTRNMKQSEMPDALSRGEVDAVSAFEPFAFRVRKRLGNNAVVISAPEVYRKTFNLVARREYSAAQPRALVKFLRAIRRAEKFIQTNPGEARLIVARRTGLALEEVATIMPDFIFALSLHQTLISLLEDEARWAIRRGWVPATTTVPNYLDLMYPDALKAIDPESVTIIH